MTNERWRYLMKSEEPLTKAELNEGFHWCGEFDGLLVGPGMSELLCCTCLPKEKRDNMPVACPCCNRNTLIRSLKPIENGAMMVCKECASDLNMCTEKIKRLIDTGLLE